MSHVHIRFVRKAATEACVKYEIFSPDFSADSLTENSLGTIRVDRFRKEYEFTPSALWRRLKFVLPEKSNALTTEKNDRDAEGLNYANRIHRRITAMIAADSYV